MVQTTKPFQKSQDIPRAKAENRIERVWCKFSEQIVLSMDGSGDEGRFPANQEQPK